MSKENVLIAIEDVCARFHERTTGNAVDRAVIEVLAALVLEDRGAVVAALRQLLAHRVRPEARGPEDAIPESRLWMAASAAETLGLTELAVDLEQLLEDVRGGRTLLPVYEATLMNHLLPLRDRARREQ